MAASEQLAMTALHAARGKLAAASEGYWTDSFLRHLTHGSFDASPGPLINRGQYARVAFVASAVEQFLEATRGRPAQIVSLGAGYDTCFWLLHEAGAAPRLYVELDQAEVVERKSAMISSQPSLLAALPEGAACVTPHGITSGSSGYRLLPADLTDVSQLESALDAAGWSAAEPTLVIAECVLVYMVPPAAVGILEFFGRRCARAVLAAYEMIGPDDPFGRTMVDNLRRRGCPLLGLKAVPDTRAQEARCVACGWGRAEAVDMLRFFDTVVSRDEHLRVNRLGLLDELEEWRMLLTHYCATLAVSDNADEPLLGRVALRTPLTSPPFAALRARAAAAAADPSSDAADAGGARASKAPPLGDTFREEDEAATWSDEEEGSGGGVAPPTTMRFIDSPFTTKVEYEAFLRGELPLPGS